MNDGGIIETGSKAPPPLCPQTEGSRLREHLHEQEERLKTLEGDSERKDQRIQELQRLLGGMEQESAALRETIRSREEELGNLRRMREEGRQGEERSVNSCTRGKEEGSVRLFTKLLCAFRAERLEKEVAILKEKIHHLDDMLKSQQRKVRHMIEQVRATCRQTKGKHFLSGWYSRGIRSVFDCLFAHLQLQNSRMVIQERDRVIKELEEKVAFLEAEVRAVEFGTKSERVDGEKGGRSCISEKTEGKMERDLVVVHTDL